MSIRVKYIHFPDWAKVIEGLKNQKEKDPIIVSDPAEARTFLKTANSTINPFYYFIVFIKETKEIYTHGEFYNCSDTGSSDIDQILEEIRSNINTLEADKVDSKDFANLVSEVEENEEVTAKALTELNNVKASKVDVDELINQIKDLINLKEDRLSCDDFKTINGICPLGEGEINIVEPDHFRTNPTVQSGTIQTVSVNGDGHVTSITARSLTPTDIPDLDARKISSGTISIDRLPAGALERLYTVATESAAMSLTIQEGDVVRVTGNDNKMYFCVSDSASTFADKFTEFTAGSATSVPWSGITDKPVGIDGWGDRIGVIEGTYAKTEVVNSMLTGYLPKSSISDWALQSTPPAIKSERLTNLDSATPWTAFYSSSQPLNRPEGANFFTGITLTNTDVVANNPSYNVQLALAYDGAIYTRYRTQNIYNSWRRVAFLSEMPTKLSQLTDDVVAGNYLSKSGGTMTAGARIVIADRYNDKRKTELYSSGLLMSGHESEPWTNGVDVVDANGNVIQSIAGAYGRSSYEPQYLYFGGKYNAPTLKLMASGEAIFSNTVNVNGAAKFVFDNDTSVVIEKLAGGYEGACGISFFYGGFIKGSITASTLLLNPKYGGNVAIGGTTADEKLHVHGNVKATSFIGDLTGIASGNLPSSGGIISGGNIAFNGTGLPALNNAYVPAGQMGIASNGILISGKDTYRDGVAIFLENGGTESNKLIIALGDDANNADIMTKDYIAFRYYGTDGVIHAESKIPKNTGIIALTSDIPTKVSQLTNDAGYTTATGHTHSGLVGDIITFTKSLNITTDWQDTGISYTDIPDTGTYIIQLIADLNGVAGQWSEHYSGVMSWYAGGTNSTDADEIFLHKAGHSTNGKSLFLRTCRSARGGDLKLQIASTDDFGEEKNLTFRFRKMI